jgi:Zn-dependent membrane protease YugP
MYFIAILFGVAGMLISWRLKSKFKTYSQTPIQSNLSGHEIAERMLADHGITDVRVISVEGQLTDHYNPADKTVNLSADVYHGRNAAAAEHCKWLYAHPINDRNDGLVFHRKHHLASDRCRSLCNGHFI